MPEPSTALTACHDVGTTVDVHVTPAGLSGCSVHTTPSRLRVNTGLLVPPVTEIAGATGSESDIHRQTLVESFHTMPDPRPSTWYTTRFEGRFWA